MKPLLLAPSHTEAAALAERLPGLPTPQVCGVGVIAAALGTSRLLAPPGRPGAVVLAGIAGSHDLERAPLGHAVLGRAVLDQAVGAGVGRDFVSLAGLGLPPADSLPESLPLLAPSPPGTPWTVGLVGTVGAASADPAQAAAWHARHPQVLVEEMEGFAVALACRAAGLPLAILRGVSNRVGERDKRRWQLGAALDALAAALPPLLDVVSTD